MYDTLWIGCSHSTDVYTDDNKIVSDVNNSAISIKPYYNYFRNDGIPIRTRNFFKDQKWKILSFPGEGVFKYAQAINVLDKHGLLKKFRNIIIQKTYEPRLCITDDDNDVYRELVDYINSDIEYTFSGWRGHTLPMNAYGMYESMVSSGLPKNSYLWATEYTLNLHSKIDSKDWDEFMPSPWVDVSYEYIKHTAKKNKLNYYEFNWIRPFRDKISEHKPTKIINGDLDITEWLRDNDYEKLLSTPGSHPTLPVAMHISKLLAKELKDAGYK